MAPSCRGTEGKSGTFQPKVSAWIGPGVLSHTFLSPSKFNVGNGAQRWDLYMPKEISSGAAEGQVSATLG